MKYLLVCTLMLFSTTRAEVDWSQVKSIVAAPSGFEDFQASYDPKITNGEEAAPHAFPHQVGLLITTPNGTYNAPGFCGASLISTSYVLTAAHCAVISKIIEVVVGAHKIKELEATQQRVNVSEIFVHPKWNPRTLANDIAILKLAHNVTLNEYVKIIGLPRHAERRKTFKGQLATASGWGKDSDQAATISDVLRYVSFKVISNTKCMLKYPTHIKDTHICCTGKRGKSTCNGDSGGALTLNGNKQIGIVSFGIALGCEKGWPPAFTRVSRFLDWIEENSDVVIEK